MGLGNWVRRLWNSLRAVWVRFRAGAGFDVAELARRLDVPAEHLHACRPTYHPRQIPKRSGGVRQLSVPAADLKALQRRILRRLLKRLRCHPAAKGFQPGESIVTNALPHAGRAVVVRLDVRDFFPTTTTARVLRYFRRIGWNRPAAELLTRLCTHAGGLAQGAPTSPRLSNLLNYRLDARIAGAAAKVGARYTRYADDITLSFGEDDRDRVRSLIRFVRKAAGEEGYRVHGRKKLRIRRRHQQQRVTGLVVNAGVRLPRRVRRWLRAVEHHLATGRPASLTPEQLAGWRALGYMIDIQTGAVVAPPAGPLDGAWVVVLTEPAGRSLQGSSAENSPDVWVFRRGQLRILRAGREETATFRLDSEAGPNAITITPTDGPNSGQPMGASYDRRDGQLTIRLVEPGARQTVIWLHPAPHDDAVSPESP
ncbi:MAG TPA: reverse transcriptase domain-containing protein [Gemmataceae bacterium]|nr:reverse transcriptase domain-containing protein [Gemmataceae bacterium]